MTGALHEMVGGHTATTFYHNLAGWVMMPLALVLYWAEIELFSRILVETKHQGLSILDLAGSRRVASRPLATNRGHKQASVL